MARYINLIELEKRINENIKPETLEEKALLEWCKDECIRQAYAMPTADVAPKSEVAKAREHGFWLGKREVAEDIFAEIEEKAFTTHDDDCGEFVLCMYCEDFEELKKKYTEEQ